MRLTDHDKRTFVRAVMGDVPFPNAKAVKANAQQDLFNAMSDTAQKLYRENRFALAKSTCYGLVDRFGLELVVGDADEEKVLQPYRGAMQALKDAETKLSGVVAACRTRKQLRDALPEFEKYLPVETAPTANVPALANIVGSFVKLGWPKGQGDA